MPPQSRIEHQIGDVDQEVHDDHQSGEEQYHVLHDDHVSLGQRLIGKAAEAWLGQARFRRDAALTGGEVDARRRLSADPNDIGARLDLATALAARGAYREALEGLLALVRGADRQAAERARAAMLDVFRVLGDEHELTQQYRSLLATSLW